MVAQEHIIMLIAGYIQYNLTTETTFGVVESGFYLFSARLKLCMCREKHTYSTASFKTCSMYVFTVGAMSLS